MPANYNADVQVTVEAGFGKGALDASIVWTDISKYVHSFKTKRGRSRLLDKTQPGRASIVLNNQDFRFDPKFGGGPYSPDINVMTPIRIRAIHNSITYGLYWGFATGWPQGRSSVGVRKTVTLPLIDGLGVIAGTSRFASEPGWYQLEQTGDRVDRILDDVGWPAGKRDIDTGIKLVAGVPGDDATGERYFYNALREIQRIEQVEQGMVWVDGLNGDLTFRDGQTRIVDETSITATFSDDGVDLPYRDLQVDFDATTIWNRVHVTRHDGVQQDATAATSVTQHGRRDLHISNTLHVADGEANALAEFLLDTYDDPQQRVTKLVIRPETDPTNLWPQAFGLDFLEQIKVKYTRIATTYNQDFHVEGVSHNVTIRGKRKWDTTFQLSPDDHRADWWVLGTSELGTDTRLYY